MTNTHNLPSLLADCIADTKKFGADTVDAVLVTSTEISARQRLGKLESLERADSRGIGIRAFVGKRQAIISSNDLTPETLKRCAERVVDMAKIAPEDPHCGLPEFGDTIKTVPDLDLYDPREPEPKELTHIASEIEEAALAVNGVTNSEGAEVGFSQREIFIAASNGFSSGYKTSQSSASVSVIAGSGTGMETDYEYSTARFFADLESAKTIGQKAGARTVKKLNPKKLETCQLSVIFEPREAKEMVAHIARAINGTSVAKGTTFLKDKMGERLFKPGIRVIDNPLLKKGLASRPFDGDGIAGRELVIIEDGILKSWITDTRSARQLGLKSTGHGSRGLSSPPSPSSTNFYMENGKESPEALIKDIKRGIYLTEAFGMGVNYVTGDYSQGAAGYLIENGEITYPISEITIAGNLLDMFAQLTPANDLNMRYSTNSPTLRIDGMTVAGS